MISLIASIVAGAAAVANLIAGQYFLSVSMLYLSVSMLFQHIAMKELEKAINKQKSAK